MWVFFFAIMMVNVIHSLYIHMQFHVILGARYLCCQCRQKKQVADSKNQSLDDSERNKLSENADHGDKKDGEPDPDYFGTNQTQKNSININVDLSKNKANLA